MFKDVLRAADYSDLAIVGLVIMVTVFVIITVWALTRSKKTVNRWSRLPLDDSPPGSNTKPDTHDDQMNQIGYGIGSDAACSAPYSASQSISQNISAASNRGETGMLHG